MTLVNGPRQRGDKLVCDGWPFRAYRAGEVFTFRFHSDVRHTVLADASPDEFGNVTLHVSPDVDCPPDNNAMDFEGGE